MPAVRLGAWGANSALEVDELRHDLDMERIDAPPVPAQMVADQVPRDCPSGHDLVSVAVALLGRLAAIYDVPHGGIAELRQAMPVGPAGRAISGLDHLSDAALELSVHVFANGSTQEGHHCH
jgi:hypothetical protein